MPFRRIRIHVHDADSDGRGVDTPTLLVGWHALHAMPARLLPEVFEIASIDFKDEGPRLRCGDGPVQSAQSLRHADIGAQEILREEAGICPAFCGANFKAIAHCHSPLGVSGQSREGHSIAFDVKIKEPGAPSPDMNI